MFTSDNCEFSEGERAELNEALEQLMSDVSEDDPMRRQIEKSYSDLLNNNWHDGITAAALVASIIKHE